MNALIVGGGRLTYFISRALRSKGYDVTVINPDHAECVTLARVLEVTVVHGDGSDPRILASAGAEAAEMFLAVTGHDEDNLIACQLATERFGVPQALALANDPDNEDVFRVLGIRAVSTTRVLSGVIEQSAGFEQISALIPVAAGRVSLSELTLEEGSPLAGHSLTQIPLPEQSLIACIIRGTETIIPRGATTLAEGDRLVVVTVPEAHADAIRVLTGSADL